MALPNHPDVFYEFVRTLRDCGYRWVLVQEHTVEQVADGSGIRRPHIPHQLIARNSRGETLSIIAIVKTQGSDTKLVGQMQPYYEAKGLGRVDVAGKSIPPLVTQIADGENGGVMMNEFPPKYMDVMREASGSATPPVNATEYLEYLSTLGLREEDLPAIQPVLQKRIWERFPAAAGPQAMEKAIEDLRKEDGRFHMEGGSWTNNLSWVQGYGAGDGAHRAGQRAFRGEDPRCAGIRRQIPQRPVLPAHVADQLLPLLGYGGMDGLRPGAVPPHHRRAALRFLRG